MKAFYFSREDRVLLYGEGREIQVGITHEVGGAIKACKNGLHASKRILDALLYAPGPILYLVELSGDLDIKEDKVAARSREYLAEFDATEVLWEFARKQALINIEKIKPYTDQYDLIAEYLQTGNKGLREAAREAACSASDLASDSAAWAARAASDSAAWAAKAASCATWEASWPTGWPTRYAAAWEASKAATESVRYPAAWEAANDMLTEMIREATGWEI